MKYYLGRSLKFKKVIAFREKEITLFKRKFY